MTSVRRAAPQFSFVNSFIRLARGALLETYFRLERSFEAVLVRRRSFK